MDQFTERYGSNNFKRSFIPKPFGKDEYITDPFEELNYTANSYIQWDNYKECQIKSNKYDYRILISGGDTVYGKDKWPFKVFKALVEKELKRQIPSLRRVAIYNLSLPGADNDWTAKSIMNAYHILHPDFVCAVWQPGQNQYEFEKLQYMMDCFFLMIQRKYNGLNKFDPKQRTVDYNPLMAANPLRDYSAKVMKYVVGHLVRLKSLHFTQELPVKRRINMIDDYGKNCVINDPILFARHLKDYHIKQKRKTCYACNGTWTVDADLVKKVQTK